MVVGEAWKANVLLVDHGDGSVKKKRNTDCVSPYSRCRESFCVDYHMHIMRSVSVYVHNQ